jgi:hypothetical protein
MGSRQTVTINPVEGIRTGSMVRCGPHDRTVVLGRVNLSGGAASNESFTRVMHSDAGTPSVGVIFLIRQPLISSHLHYNELVPACNWTYSQQSIMEGKSPNHTTAALTSVERPI